MQDLSTLAEGSMWPTSQAAGNMMSGRSRAMSAPGSKPTDPLPPAKDQGEPDVQASPGPVIRPGTDGKTQASTQIDTTPAPRPAWTTTR
jgi:hypothetical protein